MAKKRPWLRHLPVIIGAVLAVAVGVGLFLLKDLFQKPVQSKKQVQQVTILQPPPPPPPPPEQPPPPPPEVKEEKIEEPKEEPEPEPDQAEQPPGEQLGVDADGGAGSDGFGLVGRKGGRGLLGGPAGSTILWYGGMVKRGVEEELQALLADSPARKTSYSVTVNVWVAGDGRISRAELGGGSGKSDVDQSLREALGRLRISLQKPPPEGMPQPLKLRPTSRI